MGASPVWTQVMGLMGFCLVVAHLLKHYSARGRLRRAAAELPSLGAELGLQHSPSRFHRGQGSLEGTYRNRRVEIDPDDTRTILVRFEHAPAVALLSHAPGGALPEGTVELRARDERFNTFWKVRRAAPALARALAEAARSDWLEAFRGPFARNILAVRVEPRGVAIVVDFGTPPCIPTQAIRALLPACVELAERVEPRAAAAAEEPVRPPAAAAAAPDEAARGAGGVPALVRVLAVSAALACSIKIALAWSSLGGSEVRELQRLAAWARYAGSHVYVAQPGFDLPPPMVAALAWVCRLAEATGIPEASWWRGAAALAEAAALLLLYRLLDRPSAGPRLWQLLALAAWPAGIALTGLQGGPIAVAGLFVLLSIYWAERGRDALSGAACGLALCVTLAPAYALPSMCLARTSRRARLIFLTAAACVLAACWVWCWPPAPGDIIARLVHRRGTPGSWGPAWLISLWFGADSAVLSAFASCAPHLLFAGSVALALRWARRVDPPSLLARVSVTACLVAVATPSFQLTDLALLAPLALAAGPRAGAFFALCSTALVLRVYGAAWAEGGSWLAVAARAPNGARGPAEAYQLLCCGSLLALAVSAHGGSRGAAWIGAWRAALPRTRGAWAVAAAALLAASAALPMARERTVIHAVRSERDAGQRGRNYIDLSSWLLRRGMNAAGLQVARRATALQPTSAAAWNNLAAAYSGERRWEAAIAAATRAVQLEPSFQLAKNNLAWAVRKQREAMRARVAKQAPSG